MFPLGSMEKIITLVRMTHKAWNQTHGPGLKGEKLNHSTKCQVKEASILLT